MLKGMACKACVVGFNVEFEMINESVVLQEGIAGRRI